MSQLHRPTLSRRIFVVFNTLFMLFLSFFCIAPVLHVVFASFSEPERLLTNTGIILRPLGFTLKGYEIIFSNDSLLYGYLNTIFYIIAGGALSTTLTALGAYVLSRKKVLWGNKIMLFLMLPMMFGGGLIPFYMLVTSLGLYDTRWAIIVPTAIAMFNIIILRTSLREIPDSLEESAKIDGAGHFTIMTRVVMPLVKPTLAVIILFFAVNTWNSWFQAAIFLRTRNLFPLQLILREILVQNDTSAIIKNSQDALSRADLYKPLVKYASIVATTMPVLFFYPFAQKYFVTGVMLGSLKG